MKSLPDFRFKFQRRGSSIVVTLALVALFTAILLAFFTRAQNYHAIEASASARVRSEIFAQSALNYTIGLLTQEVTDPSQSEVIQVAGTRIFKPKTRDNMLPVVKIPTAMKGDKSAHYPSITKFSHPLFDPMTSDVRSSTPNKDGRYTHSEQWNEPSLFLALKPWGKNDAPFWIYFDENGPTRTASPTLVGRTAFTIHQTDCLIDYSVAGYPAAMAGDILKINALKATLAGADLTQVMTVSRDLARDPQNRFVDVRSRRSARDGSYLHRVLSNNNGFIDPPEGDTQFISRLDLLRFGKNNEINFNAQSYMTPWSRTVDAPSWAPATPNAANVFAPAILRTHKAAVTDYLVDGTQRKYTLLPGTAVASRRFALNRIAWFESTSTQKDDAIKQYFGLVKDAQGRWVYEDTHIKTLTELRAATREPNFFEMLKAAIVNDSVGRSFPGTTASLTAERDADKDLQIFRIGANIIDAARPNNFPTTIVYTNAASITRQVYGVKDLPYLYGVRFRQITKTDAGSNIQQVDQFAIPILVNPHAAPLQTVSRPPVRLRMVGSFANAKMTSRHDTDSSGDRIIAINPDAHQTPHPPLNDWTPSTSSEGTHGFPPMPDYFTGKALAFWITTSATKPNVETQLHHFNLVLEYCDNAGVWVPYDALVGDGSTEPAAGLGASVAVTIQSANKAAQAPDDTVFNDSHTPYFIKPDPRTNRWGVARGETDAPLLATDPATVITMTAANDYATIAGADPPTPGGIPPLVVDQDGISRLDDVAVGRRTAASPKRVLQDVLANRLNSNFKAKVSEDRNVILHRPYYTTGELGCVFRDDPWRTLNFASPDSGDSALLEYFDINEIPPDGVVAGRININTQSPKDSIFSQLMDTSYLIGQAQEYITGGRPHRLERTSNDHAYTIQTLYSREVGLTPLRSLADLVGILPVNRLTTEMAGSKQRQEVLVRALGTAGQTRTWNYFIDIISQTGRMSPLGSTDLALNFIPQGETRLWVHIAIDRFTGKVVSSHMEQFQD